MLVRARSRRQERVRELPERARVALSAVLMTLPLSTFGTFANEAASQCFVSLPIVTSRRASLRVFGCHCGVVIVVRPRRGRWRGGGRRRRPTRWGGAGGTPRENEMKRRNQEGVATNGGDHAPGLASA